MTNNNNNTSSLSHQIPEEIVHKIILSSYHLNPHPLAKMLKNKIKKANYQFNINCEQEYVWEYYYELEDEDGCLLAFRHMHDEDSPDLQYEEILNTDEYKEFRTNAELTTQFCHKFGLIDGETGRLREDVMPWDLLGYQKIAELD